MKFSNTDEFRKLAIYFEKNKCYTKAPTGTTTYKEFWDEVVFLSKNGFTNSDGIKINGIHWFYLNFIQILAEDKNTGRNRRMFPRFLDIDYEFFNIVELARKNKKGVILTKPRRTGFSLKNAALVTHEYIFYPDSKSIIGSFYAKYSETTMGMVLNNLNFLDENTAFVRPRSPDQQTYIKARHQVNLDGTLIWRGFMSEVHCISFKDNPFASAGKMASLFIFEEAGLFSNIIQSYNISEPTWKNGQNLIGLPIVFGSAGDMDSGTKEFCEMFYNPERFNLLAFDNTWDENKELTKCGWFIPATRGRLGEYKGIDLVDKDGNSNQELALEAIIEEREIKGKHGNSNVLRDLKTQYPLTLREAFLRNKGSVFPTAEIGDWLGKVETTPTLRDAGVDGELYFDNENKIKFRPSQELIFIEDFPHKKEDDSTGCIRIWEQPEFIGEENPYGLYIGGCDPIDQDKAEYSTSLGSFFIYKTLYRQDKTHNIIVAEYTGRPNFASEFYENCRKLCIYYNAKCLYENQLKGLKGYFEQKNSLRYLYETPQILKDIVKDSRVNRGYGIHMSKEIKAQLEIFLKDWLLEERENSEGNKILNLHTILSKPLLRELLAYDGEINTDRVIAFMLCILKSKDNYRITVNKEPEIYEIDAFFKKKIFRKNSTFFN